MFMEPLKEVASARRRAWLRGSTASIPLHHFDPALGRYRTRTEVMVAGMTLGGRLASGFGLLLRANGGTTASAGAAEEAL
jgi:hypothetical protein